jgi:hypothetical protein
MALRVAGVSLVLAGALSGFGPAAGASAAPCQAWTGGQPPGQGTGASQLSGAAVLSPCYAWAVGSSQEGTTERSLIEHWDGTGWSVIPSPSPGTAAELLGVRALSPRDAWAVGDFGDGTTFKTFILHWDGKHWTRVPSPSPGGTGSVDTLASVAVTSASNAWAVGRAGNQTLILRWNGHAWTRVTSPHPRPASLLQAVSAVSSTDAWAVGDIVSALAGRGVPPIQTLILHWNGASWKQVTSPNPGASDSLAGVSAVSAQTAWAVGTTSRGSTDSALILRWNGHGWARAPGPANTGSSVDLIGVAATSTSSAWAVGISFGSQADTTVILRWNGRRWARVSSPSPGGVFNSLHAVAATSASNAWAVGDFADDGPFQPLAIHCC